MSSNPDESWFSSKGRAPVAYVRIEGNFGLTKENLWPNDDAPEYPTFADILEALRGTDPSEIGIFPKIQVIEPGGNNVAEWPWGQ
jgi:hypothetical protein